MTEEKTERVSCEVVTLHIVKMEDFNGEVPVEVEMNIDSSPIGDESEVTQVSNVVPKPSPQPARKPRRSRRSKLSSHQTEAIKMECNLCSFETSEGRSALQDHYLDDHSKVDLASTLISITYPDALDDSANDSPDSAKLNVTKRSASLHACPVCQKNIAGKNNLEKHLIRHSSQKPFKCDECKKMFSAKRDLQLHEMRHHSKERPHVCPTCNKGKHIFEAHKKLNLKEIVWCGTCKYINLKILSRFC